MGYTFGMKTAVSIPDDVFDEAARLADRLQPSRSQLYARALSEFVARHDDDRVTSKMNEVIEEVGAEHDEFSHEAARQTLRRAQW
jgi:predicted transcriptional regulator